MYSILSIDWIAYNFITICVCMCLYVYGACIYKRENEQRRNGNWIAKCIFACVHASRVHTHTCTRVWMRHRGLDTSDYAIPGIVCVYQGSEVSIYVLFDACIGCPKITNIHYYDKDRNWRKLRQIMIISIFNTKWDDDISALINN